MKGIGYKGMRKGVSMVINLGHEGHVGRTIDGRSVVGPQIQDRLVEIRVLGKKKMMVREWDVGDYDCCKGYSFLELIWSR